MVKGLSHLEVKTWLVFPSITHDFEHNLWGTRGGGVVGAL